MSNFILGLTKLEELFSQFGYSTSDQKYCLLTLIDLTFGRNEVNPFYEKEALKIRSELPFLQLSIEFERLIYNSFLEYLNLGMFK